MDLRRAALLAQSAAPKKARAAANLGRFADSPVQNSTFRANLPFAKIVRSMPDHISDPAGPAPASETSDEPGRRCSPPDPVGQVISRSRQAKISAYWVFPAPLVCAELSAACLPPKASAPRGMPSTLIPSRIELLPQPDGAAADKLLSISPRPAPCHRQKRQLAELGARRLPRPRPAAILSALFGVGAWLASSRAARAALPHLATLRSARAALPHTFGTQS